MSPSLSRNGWWLMHRKMGVKCYLDISYYLVSAQSGDTVSAFGTKVSEVPQNQAQLAIKWSRGSSDLPSLGRDVSRTLSLSRPCLI